MKTRLFGLIACVAIFAGLGAAQADIIVIFTANGMFSDGATLTGTMEMDASGGNCIIGGAGCPGNSQPGASAPSFMVSSYPTETFVLGANPGFSGPNTVGLPLVSHPFCCGDLSMQVYFSTPDAADLTGYDGGPITAGQVVADCGVNGVCNLHSMLTGTFTPETTGAIPEPSMWAMMLIGFAGVGFVGYRRVKGGRRMLAA